ncbi:NUDIX hydrolase [Limibacter armeniacum]|uniref:NUDIX hydrolase n=1 Tax=Limibacter armeniacum TaxID=466084 RepID=UPI002FE5C5C0
MNFCSHCGSQEIRFEIPADDTFMRHICSNCGTIHYQNPKMVVGCLPLYKGKVLMARRAIEPRLGLWNLPAGFMENGEKAEEGAIREVWEETEAKVKIDRLHALYSLPQFNQVYLHFIGELESDQFAKRTSESLEVKLFDFDEIPWDEIAFESSTFALKKYLKNPDSEKVHIGYFHYKHLGIKE